MPIDTICKACADMAPEWQKIRDVFAGPTAVKSPERRYVYLPRLPGQRLVRAPLSTVGTFASGMPPGIAVTAGMIDEYAIYLDRAVLLSGFLERTLHGLVGMAMRIPPTVSVPQAIKSDLDNLTLDGTTLAGFAKQMLSEDLAVSWGGVLVDWSERFARPYQRFYPAETVTNWRMELLDGQPVPTRVVLAEQVMEPDPKDLWTNVCIDQRRVLELVPDAGLPPDAFPFGRLIHQLWRKMTDANGKADWVLYGPPIMPMRREQPLGFIPFQPVNALAASWMVTRPVLLNLTNMVIAHYKNSADYENAIHAAGVPTLGVWGIDTERAIEVGAGRVISGENPAGHAEWVQTGGAGAAEIKAAMEAKESVMATMAARLLLSQQRRVAETAESQRVGFVGDDASLTTVVDAVEQALTNACVWHTWWAGPYQTVAEAEDDVSIRLNRDFIEHPLPGDELNRLGIEVDAGRLPRRDYFVNAQRGGVIRPELTYEEYEAELASEDAAREEKRAVQQEAQAAEFERQMQREEMRAERGNGATQEE